MKKTLALLLPLVLCLLFGRGVFSLYAQGYDDEEDDSGYNEDDPGYNEDIPFESDWDDYPVNLYSMGDQTFTLSAGVNFPVLFLNNGKTTRNNFTPPIGGTLGPMAYSYFLGSHFFLGAEIGFTFNATLGQNMVFIIPIGLRAGWQFVLRRIEIPLILTVGMAPQRYLENTYLGLFVRGGGAVFYRFSPEWSFGLNADWSWYPQWIPNDGEDGIIRSAHGNFIGLTLSARYHF